MVGGSGLGAGGTHASSAPPRPVWGPSSVLTGAPGAQDPGPPADPAGAVGARCASVQCPILSPGSRAQRAQAGRRTGRCAGCDQGCDREGAATSQGGSGPAHLSGGRSRGWDGQAPRCPPPASWPARGGGGFPWPFGVSGSVGLRKELVLVTWRGATPSRGAGHLLSCLLLPVCKDPGRFPGTPTSLPEGSPRRVRKTTEAKTSG